MKTDEQAPEEVGKEITPGEEILDLVKDRAADLFMKGDGKRAAEILTAYAKSKLPDGHPSKKLKDFQILGNEQVSMLASFEKRVSRISDISEFLGAFFTGGSDMLNVALNGMMLADFIRDKHPELYQEATQYLIERKVAQKAEQDLTQIVEEEKPKKVIQAKKRPAKKRLKE